METARRAAAVAGAAVADAVARDAMTRATTCGRQPARRRSAGRSSTISASSTWSRPRIASSPLRRPMRPRWRSSASAPKSSPPCRARRPPKRHPSRAAADARHRRRRRRRGRSIERREEAEAHQGTAREEGRRAHGVHRREAEAGSLDPRPQGRRVAGGDEAPKRPTSDGAHRARREGACARRGVRWCGLGRAGGHLGPIPVRAEAAQHDLGLTTRTRQRAGPSGPALLL